MAVYVQCPQCWVIRSLKAELCPRCGHDIKNARKQKKVKYATRVYFPSLKKYRTEFFETLKDAQQAERDYRQSKEEHSDDAVLYLGDKVTVEELMDWFLKLKSIQKTARYRNGVYSAHQKLIKQAIGPYPVAKLTLTTLEDFQTELEEQYKSNYVDSVFKTLKQAINKGVDDDQLPMWALKPFRKFSPSMPNRNADARYRIITPEEFNLLHRAALPHHRPFLATLYWTGMRPGEALDLVWPQVHLARRQIILEATDTKTEDPRIIPIAPPLFEVLKIHPHALHTKHVFHYRNKPIKDVYQSMRKLSEKAGIPWGRKVRNGWTLHDLRHTWVTNARRSGIAESVIMKITGHTTREMFDRYNFVDEKDAMLAGAMLTQFMQNREGSDQSEAK